MSHTRTRAKQTSDPADPSGQVGLFVCGPTVSTSRTSTTPRPTQFDFLVRVLRARGLRVVDVITLAGPGLTSCREVLVETVLVPVQNGAVQRVGDAAHDWPTRTAAHDQRSSA